MKGGGGIVQPRTTRRLSEVLAFDREVVEAKDTQGTERRVADILALLCLTVAFAIALHEVRGLTWPPEMDHYRDMGSAQEILDGHIGADATFKGELQWYPPLLPLIGAGLSRVTGAALPKVWVQMGPYLNLLGPLTFYLLIRLMMAPMAAFAALAAFLFLGPPAMDMSFQATYCPWAWPNQFVQALFYSTTALWLMAVRTGRIKWEVATGVMLGVTFLGHAAPALILAGGFALQTAWSWRTFSEERRASSRRLVICAAVSVLAASPAMIPLALRYSFHMHNELPGRNAFIGIASILKALFRPRGLIALVGVVWLVRGRFTRWDRQERATVLALGFVSAAALCYGLMVAAFDRRGWARLPMPVPSFHFHIYLKAFESLFFGLGAAAVVSRASRLTNKLGQSWMLAAGTLVLVLIGMPDYIHRRDVVRWPPESRRLAGDHMRVDLYQWARKKWGPEDVTLAPIDLSLFALTPAARHSVAILEIMASPYVPAHQRMLDQIAMFDALRGHDDARFLGLAKQYGVTHVVLDMNDRSCCSGTPREPTEALSLELDAPPLRIYAVHGT